MLEYLGVQNQAEEWRDAFGGCPECGQSTGFTYSGRKRWHYCATHKTRWCGGEILSCYWKIEVTQEFARGEAEVNSYREVEPLIPSYSAPLKTEIGMTDKELSQHLRVLAYRIERRAEEQFQRMMGQDNVSSSSPCTRSHALTGLRIL